jgi:hypothetical protein
MLCKVAVGRGFSKDFGSSCQFSFYGILHTIIIIVIRG